MSDVRAEEDFASDSLRVVAHDGRTVVRRTGWWSPAVHGLLTYLERTGFAESARFRGLDERGDERLEHIAGVSGLDAWRLVIPESGLRAYARLLRRYHDAVAGYVPPEGAEWMTASRGLRAGEILTHGDVGPWNTVWRDGEPVGLLDWDQAGPRPALHDVAYALEYAVPFRSDADAMAQIGFPAPPDRTTRMRVFAEAYGLPSTDGLVDAVLAEQEETLRATLEVAARGLEPHATWVREGFVAEQEHRIAWTREHRDLFV
ncbi:phosphotransferase [Amnibacterium kyonggiense]|uniref:Phosphotransferase family enzyme n=1 Tax=Amnibacterium kyonggiense TaxID=595671 RepID=A0A4R7FJ45_9MICO|nr:phosphotransferase [Amnibacterium kyonggiense]TDS75972.1 phosphotransferase family enzyme [Amnibacterium kyonggiense]